MPVPDELPSTLQRCDREQGGCGTPFSVTLNACPNCQRSVPEELNPSRDGEPPTENTDSMSEGHEASRDSAPELEAGPSEKAHGKPPKR